MVKPRSWISIPVPEFHPETWDQLPGYAEAEARGFRDLPAPAVERVKRRFKSVAQLETELAALIERRDRIMPPMLPNDPGAFSGISRTPIRGREAAHDNALREHARITALINSLTGRISRAKRREAS